MLAFLKFLVKTYIVSTVQIVAVYSGLAVIALAVSKLHDIFTEETHKSTPKK